MLHRILLSIIATLFVMSLATAQPNHHYGDWSGEWSGVQYVEDNCNVPSGQTLTLLAGTEVRFLGDFEILVNPGATLEAQGTEQSQVLFTADQGTQPGTWRALIADGTSLNHAVMTLTNCEIRFGGEHETDPRFASGVIRCLHPCDVVVTDCFIHDNWGEGVGTDHGGANENHLELTDCRIENCEIGVKLILPDANTVVKRNWIESCLLGMRLHTDPDVGPKVANNIIKDSQGNGVEDLITFNSLLAYFKNNVIDNSGSSGMYFTSNIVTGSVQNNIFVNNHRYGIEVINTRSGTVSYNSFYHNTINKYTANVQSRPEVTVNPELTEAFGDENFYHLQWDSPCLEQGNDDPEMHNSNPAESRGDIGAYGGPELDPDLDFGLYWVNITDAQVTGVLDQDASPYHVLGNSNFSVPYGQELSIIAQGAPCELYFDGDDATRLSAWGNLEVAGSSQSENVVFGLLEGSAIPWWGIRTGSTQGFSSHQIQYAEISGADNGIIAYDCNLWVDHCHVHNCTYSGLNAQDMQFTLTYSTLCSNGRSGLVLWPEAQVKALRDTINNNNWSGVIAISHSKFIADYTFDIPPVNYIFDNGNDDPLLYHQIDLYDLSSALMTEGHNQITDNDEVLVFADEHHTPPNPVKYNWWGEPDPSPYRFVPTEMWPYLPCDTEPWGQGQGGRSGAELAFANAVALEETGDYLAAEAAYRYVVANYTTDALASEALNRTFYCTRQGNGGFTTQVAYYQDIWHTCSLISLAKLARELNWRSLLELDEFQEALDQCEEVITNPPSLADSILAVMDAGLTYLVAEAHGGGLESSGPFGIYLSLRPANYEDYLRRSEEFLAMIQSHENMVEKDNSSAFPLGFALAKPYPNPFNAATRISYSLLDTRDVNLAVYDVLGRNVIDLVNGRQSAGEHTVVWSGESSTGIPVSSGIYFVRMSTETGVQSAKMLLLK